MGVTAVLASTFASSAPASFPGQNGNILFERSNKFWNISPAGPVNSEVLAFRPGTTVEDPEFSPNGKQLAFAADLGPGLDWQVVVSKPNGRRAVNVTRNADKCLSATSPAWAPSGQKLAFICNDKAVPPSYEVFTVKLDGTGVRRVTDVNEAEDVKWNPADSNELAFIDVGQLYTVAAGGGTPSPLSLDPPGISTRWSDLDYAPSGATIVSSADGNLYPVNSTSGAIGANLVSGGTDAQTEPSYSPDENQIAYVNSGSSVANIHVVPATGAAAGTPLTSTPSTSERDPTWRPIFP